MSLSPTWPQAPLHGVIGLKPTTGTEQNMITVKELFRLQADVDTPPGN